FMKKIMIFNTTRVACYRIALTLVTLMMLVSLLHAQQKADVILHNGKIATLVKENEFVEAVAIKGGLILETGSSKQILEKFADKNTKRINLNRRTVVPGLNDSHIH